MSKIFIAEDLVHAIRAAKSLRDLKQLVGPGPTDQVDAQARTDMIETIWSRHGSDMQKWPIPIRERYDRLTAEQTAFENEYR